MLKYLIYCQTVIFIASILNVNAQLRCNLIHYGTENGLSHERGTCIIKDSEGFMWASSWDGINRFDGHSFTSYKSFPGDRSGLKNDRIDYIEDDNSGYLWLKGFDEYYRFEKKTEKFSPLSTIITEVAKKNIAFRRVNSFRKGSVWITTKSKGAFYIPASNQQTYYWYHSKNKKLQLPSDSVNFIFEDKQYNTWIGTTKGLVKLIPSKKGIYILTHPVKANLSFSDYSEDKTAIYFSTKQGMLVRYNKTSKQISAHKVTNKALNAIRKSKYNEKIYCSTFSGDLISINLSDFAVTSSSISPGSSILSIFEDHGGNLWLEPADKGAIRFDPSNNTFKWLQHQNNSPSYRISQSKYYNVFEDKTGTVWVCMKGGGFGYYNANKGKIDQFYENSDHEIHRFHEIVYGVYYDSNDILWICTDEGIDKVVPQGKTFSLKNVSSTKFPNSDNRIRAMLRDRKNRTWIASKDGVLNVFDGERRLGNLFINSPAEGLGSYYCFMQDSKGAIWIGTKFNGLFKAEPVNNDETQYLLSHYKSGDRPENGLNFNDIFSLFEDKTGRVWVGTFGKGLNFVSSSKAKVLLSDARKALINYPKENFENIRHLNADSNGNLWVATTDGLLVINTKTTNFSKAAVAHYTKSSGEENSIGDNDIQYIFRDNHNRMWLCTSGGGLALAVGDPFKNLTFKNYTRKDGLPSDYCVSCNQDKKGNLWIATQNGLSRFNIETNRFRNFGLSDGLFKASFSEASCTSQADGSMIFGTTKGYLSFNPDMVGRNRIKTSIVFTNLQINNMDIDAGAPDSILKQNINYVNSIRLKHDQNIISVDFSILDHKAGDKERIIYRLKGYNDTWQNDRLQRRATFTNVPPGNYIFEVRNVSDDRYLNAPVKQLSITVLSPPWKTGWAYIFYTMVISLIIREIWRNTRTKLRLKQNVEVERQMADLKLNFFTNISHELRTPLTLILNPIDEIAKTEHLSLQGKQYINLVKKNAARLSRFMDNWLDLRKLQSGKQTLKLSKTEVHSLIRKTADYFAETLQYKEIDLQVTSNVDELFAWIDEEKIDIVIYNLISNALKYSNNGGKIWVKVHSVQNGAFEIEIADEGCGVPQNELSKIFELYRAGEPSSATKNNKGIGIGLALCKELIGLHHGTISAQNNVYGGLSVTIQLKSDKEHFEADEIQIGETVEEDSPKLDFTQSGQNIFNPEKKELPRILLVEDNVELRLFLAVQLSRFFSVQTAEDGEQGLKMATEILPELILSDIMMPKMTGIQMLEKLKNDTATSHIPIVLLSAKASIESQIEGLRYGADLYIAKPFNNEYLLESIRNLINQRRAFFGSLAFNQQKNKIELNPTEINIAPKDEQFLKRIVDIVEARMDDPEFNIDMVAEAISMSRTTFYNKFKSLTSIAPVEFVREMRLKRAKQYLDAGETNVSTVAYEVGFNSAKYFSTCFKEMYKISPKEYLRKRTEVINQ